MTLRNAQTVGMTVGAMVLAASVLAAPQRAGDVADQSPYYEKDAWYDVTEWMDGNDYNPTDETWWRWDDEKFDFHEDTGTDWDNDVYGFDENTKDNDWFYDYYDDDYVSYSDFDRNDAFEASTHYVDVNNDGLVDAYYTFSDSNGDRTFDTVNYVAFNTEGNSAYSNTRTVLSSSKDWRQSTAPTTITGEVTDAKTVTVRDGKHQIVQLKTSEGKTVVVDLGNQDQLRSAKIEKGKQLTISGFTSKVGEKDVFFARGLNVDGRTVNISRAGKSITGEVVDTHTATLRGEPHTFAWIKKSDGKQCLVDLGRTDQLGMRLTKGQKITLTGVPVKVDDRVLVLATQVESSGQMRDVNRGFGMTTPAPRNPGENARPQQRPGTNPRDRN